MASANTSIGFNNNFDSINKEKNAFTYILKGGPGTGKSTLMKKVGDYFSNKNISVEYFYCSSDYKSLDGIRVKNISIVDGTAPHVTEASLPGVKEKIVNIGKHIGDNVALHKKEIENLIAQKSKYYKEAYLYFGLISNLIKLETQNKKLEKNNLKIIENINLKKQKNKGIERKLFSSFICSQGIKNLYKKNSFENIIQLQGNIVINKNVFQYLKNKLKEKNDSFITFWSILSPDLIEAVYIKSTKTLVVSEDAYNSNLNSFKNNILLKQIIGKIAFCLKKAMEYHKKIEAIYVPQVNFASISKLTEKLILEIEQKINP